MHGSNLGVCGWSPRLTFPIASYPILKYSSESCWAELSYRVHAFYFAADEFRGAFYYTLQIGSSRIIINYLLTDSEVFSEKPQTEALPYWPSDSKAEVLDFHVKTSLSVNTFFFIIWL